jgi:hypothetical protein
MIEVAAGVCVWCQLGPDAATGCWGVVPRSSAKGLVRGADPDGEIEATVNSVDTLYLAWRVK